MSKKESATHSSRSLEQTVYFSEKTPQLKYNKEEISFFFRMFDHIERCIQNKSLSKIKINLDPNFDITLITSDKVDAVKKNLQKINCILLALPSMETTIEINFIDNEVVYQIYVDMKGSDNQMYATTLSKLKSAITKNSRIIKRKSQWVRTTCLDINISLNVSELVSKRSFSHGVRHEVV